MHTYLHTHTRARAHIHTHAHTHTRTHTYTPAISLAAAFAACWRLLDVMLREEKGEKANRSVRRLFALLRNVRGRRAIEYRK